MAENFAPFAMLQAGHEREDKQNQIKEYVNIFAELEYVFSEDKILKEILLW